MRCRVSSESSTETEEDSATKTKVSSSSILHHNYHCFIVSCPKANSCCVLITWFTEDAVWIHEEGCSVDRSWSYCTWYRAREWPWGNPRIKKQIMKVLYSLCVWLWVRLLSWTVQYVGVDPLQAGNAVQLILVLGLTLGWISTYIFRVGNKEMTYAQQLRDYESQVMQVCDFSLQGLYLSDLMWFTLIYGWFCNGYRNGWRAYLRLS